MPDGKSLPQKIAIINKALAIMQSKTKDKTRQFELLAKKHNINPSTIRRWIKRYQNGGPEALTHARARRQNPIKSIDQEALNYLFLLIQHHPNHKPSQIYSLLTREANKHGWRIGSRSSFYRLLDRLCPRPGQTPEQNPEKLRALIQSKLPDLTAEQLSNILFMLNHQL